jgi:nicotinamidase/pyrazinamidase
VKFTVLDALALGYRSTSLPTAAGVNINAQDSAQAFMEMAAEGATLYTLDDWLETQAIVVRPQTGRHFHDSSEIFSSDTIRVSIPNRNRISEQHTSITPSAEKTAYVP